MTASSCAGCLVDPDQFGQLSGAVGIFQGGMQGSFGAVGGVAMELRQPYRNFVCSADQIEHQQSDRARTGEDHSGS